MTIESVCEAIKKLESINSGDEFAYEKAMSAYLSMGILPVFFDTISPNNALFRTRLHKTNHY